MTVINEFKMGIATTETDEKCHNTSTKRRKIVICTVYAKRLMTLAIYQSTLSTPCKTVAILTSTEIWNGGVVLKLEEGPLEDILWVDLFHSQQVEYHVVGQVEG